MAEKKVRGAKDLFKPTIPKLFFPVLILILLIIASIVNFVYLPRVGEGVCDSITLMNEFQAFDKVFDKKLNENNARPQEILNLLEERNGYWQEVYDADFIVESTKSVAIGNFMLSMSGVYKLDPFFPVPCLEEGIGNDFSGTAFCEYYINKEDYECIKQGHSYGDR